MPIMNTETGTVTINWRPVGNGNGRYRLLGRGIDAVVSHRWNGREWSTEIISGHIPLDADSLHRWCAYNLY